MLCSPLPILYLFGVDRHDCISPSFSVLCELWVELVLFHIAPHSIHPPQSGPSSRSLPSHLHCCYFLCSILVVSSHCAVIPRKAFLGDICGDNSLTIASLLNFSFLSHHCITDKMERQQSQRDRGRFQTLLPWHMPSQEWNRNHLE